MSSSGVVLRLVTLDFPLSPLPFVSYQVLLRFFRCMTKSFFTVTLSLIYFGTRSHYSPFLGSPSYRDDRFYFLYPVLREVEFPFSHTLHLAEFREFSDLSRSRCSSPLIQPSFSCSPLYFSPHFSTSGTSRSSPRLRFSHNKAILWLCCG